ncbi:hypothetical protein B0J13DRAFT_86257 [Dactylonectria estremocensis]|uniref:Uncharacterized protein n=1 Tax=Dactylonectria estremocensis TaxID=1079267 RepID=A0A9P9EDP9_9HYPO|nr:hypothetical protein B0J13DRAFT_86257 [Dactylonectria estremocensis]
MSPHLRPTQRESEETEYPSDNIMMENWNPLVKAIEAITRDSVFDSPSFNSSPAAFRSHWNDVFTRLQDSILLDPKIQQFLTTPPTNEFTITFFQKPEFAGCPCCLPHSISLQNDNGVAKGDFIQAFKEYMYGEHPPQIYFSHRLDASKREMEALVHSSDWMSGPGGGVYNGERPNIVVYCCEQEQFNEMIGGKKEAKTE